MNSPIYADYNATANVKDSIRTVLPELIAKYYGNPSGLHRPGQEAKTAMESARADTANALNAKPNEIIFTSGGTESDVLGLYGMALAYKKNIKKIIVSTIEHSAVLGQRELFKNIGIEFVELPVTPSGIIDLNKLEALINKEPVILSLMLANNETGIIQPISESAQLVKTFGGYVHCDAVQAFGKIKIEATALPIDTISVSGHKIGALRGIGALYIKKGIRVQSVFGSGTHEKEIRPGTENLPGILSLGLASKNFSDWSDTEANRIYFESQLKENFNVKIAGQNASRIPNTVSVSFIGKNQDLILAALDMKGIYASAGSACKASLSMPSHVLKAMGYEKTELKGVIRFSFAPDFSRTQAEFIINTLKEILK